MYSTVGALEVSCRNSAEFSAQSAAKMRWKSVETAEERAKNGVKDVVKMVAFCALQNSHARRLVNFWYNGWQKELM